MSYQLSKYPQSSIQMVSVCFTACVCIMTFTRSKVILYSQCIWCLFACYCIMTFTRFEVKLNGRCSRCLVGEIKYTTVLICSFCSLVRLKYFQKKRILIMSNSTPLNICSYDKTCVFYSH